MLLVISILTILSFNHRIMVDLTEEEVKTIIIEVEVEEGIPTMVVEVNNNSSFTHHIFISRITLLLRPLSLVVKTSRVIDLFAKFMERQVIKPLTVITEWILPIKARIHQSNLLQWLKLLM